eukprot:1158256-Pelagomonas_calceolata.AAC.2
MLGVNVSPAADQPESQAVGQPPCNPTPLQYEEERMQHLKGYKVCTQTPRLSCQMPQTRYHKACFRKQFNTSDHNLVMMFNVAAALLTFTTFLSSFSGEGDPWLIETMCLLGQRLEYYDYLLFPFFGTGDYCSIDLSSAKPLSRGVTQKIPS